MGLVRCKECHKVISSSAKMCPHCGYQYSEVEQAELIKEAEIHPVTSFETTQKIDNHQNSNYSVEQARYEIEREGNFGVGMALGFLLGLIGLIIAIAINKRKTIIGSAVGTVMSFVAGIILLIVYRSIFGPFY